MTDGPVVAGIEVYQEFMFDGGFGCLSEEYIKEHSSDCWSFKGVSRAAQT